MSWQENIAKVELGIDPQAVVTLHMRHVKARDTCFAHHPEMWALAPNDKEKFVMCLDFDSGKFVLFHATCWQMFWAAKGTGNGSH